MIEELASSAEQRTTGTRNGCYKTLYFTALYIKCSEMSFNIITFC